MKSKNRKLAKAMEFESDEEKIRHEAEMIMFRILSQVEKLMETHQINKKDLAKGIGTSPSYITQLFRGTKLLNLVTLAKIQQFSDVRFEVNVAPVVEIKPLVKTTKDILDTQSKRKNVKSISALEKVN